MTKFLNITKLSEQIGLPARTIRSLYRTRKISAFKAGHRTLLFDAEKVCAELGKFEIKAVR